MSITSNSYWRSKKGHAYEKLALDYLRCKGLQLLTSNYRCAMGEIDLIMRKDDMLVFVEVRYRENREFGGALATVTRSKQQKLVLAARHFLLCHKDYQACCCRFDVIGVQTGSSGATEFNWIENAFC